MGWKIQSIQIVNHASEKPITAFSEKTIQIYRYDQTYQQKYHTIFIMTLNIFGQIRQRKQLIVEFSGSLSC